MDNPPVHHGQGYLHLAAIGLLHALPNGLIQPQGNRPGLFRRLGHCKIFEEHLRKFIGIRV
jgi:hypothetical protein